MLFLIKLVQFAWIKNNFDGLCEHVHTAALRFRRRPNQTRIKAHVCRASCGLLAPAVYRCRFNRSRDGSRAEGGGTASVSGRPNVSASVMRGRWGRDTLQMWSAFFFFFKPPETLLPHLFVPVLIMALGAVAGTPLAFMRLMKVGAGGKRHGAPLCALAWLCEFTGRFLIKRVWGQGG